MKPSNLVTVTTDFGIEDHYTGVMKGVILNLNPDCRIIDITNSITRFSVIQANYILSVSYKYFPEGSVHLAVVDPGVGSDRAPLIIETNEYFFVGPDNGIFSFIKNEDIKRVIRIEKALMEKTSSTFHGRDIFAPAASMLSKGCDPLLFGSETRDLKKIEIERTSYTDKKITGTIIHKDGFGNIITSIDASEFKRLTKNRSFSAKIGDLSVCDFFDTYEKAGKDLFFIEGSSGKIEISLKRKSAAKYISKKIDDTIIIDISSGN